MQYDDPMPRPGFDTYVFVERIAANAAALHPFPEHHVGLVREALADAGLEVSVLGPGAPEVGEAVYFQSEPMGDDALGLLADALTLRGIGAYAYALVGDSIGDGLADLDEANLLLSERFETEPVLDPRGMAAIEILHPEFAAGTAEPMALLDEIFQVLGAAGFEGITMCNDPGAGPVPDTDEAGAAG